MISADWIQLRTTSIGGRLGLGSPRSALASLSSSLLTVALLLVPSGTLAGQGGEPAEEVLMASTVRSVEGAAGSVVLILEDGTSFEAPAGKFKVRGLRPEDGERTEPTSPEQRKDPAYQEQQRQERAAERAARQLSVTDLEPGQAVLVMRRASDGSEVRNVVVRVFGSLQDAQDALQERLQRREARQQAKEQKSQERQREQGGDQVAAESETGG